MAHSGTPSPVESQHRPRGPLWLLFTDGEALRTVDVLRLAYAATAIGAFLLTEAGRNIYRPYIYETGINDFGLADSIGNLGGIVVQVFVSLALLNSRKTKAFNVVGFLVAGFILYEIIQPYLPKGVFDWKDIYGTIIGGIISAFLVVLLRFVVNPNRVLLRL
ncbi:MAG: hypothetical protein ACR2N7_06480 [Acidimicrobiia bacterium]